MPLQGIDFDNLGNLVEDVSPIEKRRAQVRKQVEMIMARPDFELGPEKSTISARSPYEVTMPANQIGPFPLNMSAGAPRGEQVLNPREMAQGSMPLLGSLNDTSLRQLGRLMYSSGPGTLEKSLAVLKRSLATNKVTPNQIRDGVNNGLTTAAHEATLKGIPLEQAHSKANQVASRIKQLLGDPEKIDIEALKKQMGEQGGTP